jgi:hypothetical protein
MEDPSQINNNQELQLNLEHARRENLQTQERLAEQQQHTEQLRHERHQIDIDVALKKALQSTGIKFYPQHDELKLILGTRWSFDIAHDGRVEATDKNTGKIVDFEKAVIEFALGKSFLADGRTLKRYVVPEKELSKADFATAAQKAQFIARNGVQTWERLPLRPSMPVNVRTMTAADYAKLPRAEKVKLVDRYGQSFVSEVLKRK